MTIDLKDQTIQVVFSSRSEQYKIPEAPIILPLILDASGLNKVVHHFFQDESKKIPFNFVIKEKLINATINDCIMQLDEYNREEIFTIEYFPQANKPEMKLAFEMDDWISCIEVKDDLAFVGCYDNEVYVFDQSGEKVGNCCSHASPVKCLDVIKKNDIYVVASGDLKGKVYVSLFSADSFQTSVELTGHELSVESICFSPSGNHIVAGSVDGNILMWDVQDFLTANSSIESLTPLFLFDLHKEKVTEIIFLSEFKFVSCGLDRQICLFDIETKSTICSLMADVAILSMSISKSGLIATGHSDSFIRVWELRDDSLFASLKIQSSSNMNIVRWDSSEFQMLVSSYDGSVKLFDIRSSNTPILIIENPTADNKMFACSFQPKMILYGGESCQLFMLKNNINE